MDNKQQKEQDNANSQEELQMNNNTLKQRIYDFINEMSAVSFAELRQIKGFNGDHTFRMDGENYSNMVLWIGMSAEAITALTELIEENKIKLHEKHQGEIFSIYSYDGCIVPLEVAKTRRHYKEPRWLPTMLYVSNYYDSIFGKQGDKATN